MADADVIIIGAGPVGLTLALHLDMYGVTSTILEEQKTLRIHPKGNTINVRTMEIFRKLGIVDRVRELGMPADHPYDVAFFTRLSTFEIARSKLPSRKERLEQRKKAAPIDQMPEPPHRGNQMYIERVLMDQALARGRVTAHFACKAESYVEDADGVTVSTSDGRKFRGKYVIGCDGAHGMVRKTLGIKYGGQDQLLDAYMAGVFSSVHVRIPDLYPKFVGHRKAWMYMAINADTRTILVSLNGSDEFRMHMPGPTKPDAEVIAFVRKAIGADIPVEVIGNSPWTAGAYLTADSYGRGRAFLAGDAAHLFTPAGGFGLNCGVDDTSNLSWKLAAMLQGWGGPKLLESYEIERRPIAVRATSYAREIGKHRVNVTVTPVADEDSPAGAAERLAISQTEFVAHNHFSLPEERDSMGVILGTRFDQSPVIVADGTPPEESLELYAPSSVPGGRAPHFWVGAGRETGDSVYDKFGLGFALLRVGANPPDVAQLVAAAARRKIPLAVVDAPQPYVKQFYDRALYLVRPDQFIAWRGDAVPADIDGLLAKVTGR